MKNGLIICVSILSILGLSHNVWAVSAAPIIVTLTQPDGFTFEAMQQGDEYASWMETLDGISIVQDGGEWFYAAEGVTGDLISSGSSVGSLSQADLAQWPLGLSPYVDPDTREKHYPMRYRESADPSRALTHTQNVLTILVDYTDETFTYTDASFQSLIYGASASVKDFFSDNSYGSFTVSPAAETYGTSNDGIVHISRAIAHPDLGGALASWRAEASAIVSAVDGDVDFSSFDTDADGTISVRELSIVIILAGYEASIPSASTPNVWGHKYSFSTITPDGVGLSPYTMFGERHQTHQATIGIMCHELGHLMLGLPDLYDRTPGGDADSNGIGEWGLMGSGSWNRTGSFFGDSPSHLSAWSKDVVGMLDATDVDASASGVSIAQVETNPTVKRLWADAYKSPIGEHFLLENRQSTGYDAGLPANGLLIWHIDGSAGSNDDETHKMVDLEAADGLTDLDNETNRGDSGDPFPGTSNNLTFNDASTPNSQGYAIASTGIAVTTISASASTMTADLTPSSLSFKGTVWYNENLYNLNWGFGSSTVWTAIETYNGTTGDTIDGFEVYIIGTSATVDFRLYSSLSGTTPTTLLHTETGFSATNGWNRFMLASPQSFPAASTRVVVLRIVDASELSVPAAMVSEPQLSGRSYMDADGVGAYFPLLYDLSQTLLLSGFDTLDADNVYVDFSWGGTEIGTEPSPFSTLAGALAVVNAAGTVWMDAGASSVQPTINQSVTLKTTGGAVTIGGP